MEDKSALLRAVVKLDKNRDLMQLTGKNLPLPRQTVDGDVVKSIPSLKGFTEHLLTRS